MARKTLIGLLAAAFFGCEDGCREAARQLEQTPLSSEHMSTMVSLSQSRKELSNEKGIFPLNGVYTIIPGDNNYNLRKSIPYFSK